MKVLSAENVQLHVRMELEHERRIRSVSKIFGVPFLIKIEMRLFINDVTQIGHKFVSFPAPLLDRCCIFRPAFGCCAPQTLVEIVIFSVFSAKKLKKSKKFASNFCKKICFLSLHQNAGQNIQQLLA